MDGLLPILKPFGWTSFDVVRYLKKVTKQEKIGHAGNLDASATGILLVGLGRATKLLSNWLHADKEYLFQVQFGIATETLDRAGQDYRYAAVDPAYVKETTLKQRIREAYIGPIHQTPPRYCALKVNGKRYADLAREQIAMEPPERTVTIFSLEVMSFISDNMYPSAVLRVHCSHGTYVRALCRDLANDLHTIGMAKEICRTRIGKVMLDQAVPLSELLRADAISTYLYREPEA